LLNGVLEQFKGFDHQHLQPAPLPARPSPAASSGHGGGNPKGKGPLQNPEQNVIDQGAAAAATIIKAVITTIDPAAQACVDTHSVPDCALAFLLPFTAITSDGASSLEDPALAEGLSADTGLATDTGTAGCALASVLPGGMSFTAATPVLLPGGKTAPIATLKPGDKVLATSTSTSTSKTSPETVAAVEVHHDTNLYNLNIKTPHGIQVIHTTANHLFWDPTSRQWVQAAKLRKGEHLKTANGVTAVADGGTTPKNHDGWMWDLTIPGNNDHDFYVLPVQRDGQYAYSLQAGNAPVLVHNTDDECPTFPNRYQDPEVLRQEMEAAAAAKVSPISVGTEAFSAAVNEGGSYLWAVGKDGELRIIRNVSDDIKHSVLFEGARVRGAGTVEFPKGGCQ
jgi:hypothetical protein